MFLRFSSFFMMLLFFNSCSEDTGNPVESNQNEPIKLSLVKMTGSVRGSEATGSNMEMQE